MVQFYYVLLTVPHVAHAHTQTHTFFYPPFLKKCDWSGAISCYQLSNGIMQNTITMERTLQCVEAGQVFILKGGSVDLYGTLQTAMSSLRSVWRAI